MSDVVTGLQVNPQAGRQIRGHLGEGDRVSMQKHPRIRIQKHLDAANGQSCIRCTRQDGTVVLCHYSGLYAHRFGKGVSVKAHDICGADLCMECHGHFDHYREGNDDARAAEFLSYCLLTLVRRFENRQMGWVGK